MKGKDTKTYESDGMSRCDGEHNLDGVVTKNEGNLLVNNAIDSLEIKRYDSRAMDGNQGKKWEEFLSVASEILVHYMQYLKENGKEI